MSKAPAASTESARLSAIFSNASAMTSISTSPERSDVEDHAGDRQQADEQQREGHQERERHGEARLAVNDAFVHQPSAETSELPHERNVIGDAHREETYP